MRVDLRKYPLNSLRRHPGRTAALAALVALLSFAVLAGSLVVSSLQRGLTSLEERMGADVLVAPRTARSQTDLEEILVEGVPGYFYMDKSLVEKVAAIEGVERVSPQFFLVTAKAGCCTMPVQVIGFDPSTDFSVKPWIDRGYAKELGREEVVVGANISGAVGSQIMLYGVQCTIVSKLDATGTAMDNAVYCTEATVQDLIQGSIDQGVAVLEERDPTDVISTIQVDVADGYSAADVAGDINVHVRDVWAVQAREMTTDVAQSMGGVARVVGGLVVAVWVLAVAVLAVAFVVLGRQRTREFAVLRVLGAPARSVVRIVATESLLVSVIGSAVGIVLACVVVVAFGPALEVALGLPFLVPEVATIALFALATLAASVGVGTLASGVSARRLSKVDASQILREE